MLTQFTDPERFSGGIAAADYDGDGDVDLYVVGGNTEPNHLYQDQGDGTYDEVATPVGLDLVHWGSGPDNVVMYRNDTDNGNHFLNIRLQGAGNNHLGIGAHITVTTDEVAQVREMGGKNHYVSHSPYEVYFGLGSASTADIPHPLAGWRRNRHASRGCRSAPYNLPASLKSHWKLSFRPGNVAVCELYKCTGVDALK